MIPAADRGRKLTGNGAQGLCRLRRRVSISVILLMQRAAVVNMMASNEVRQGHADDRVDFDRWPPAPVRMIVEPPSLGVRLDVLVDLFAGLPEE